ncbi:MAG TPA: cytochrome c1, partial [Verrucomicrobiales bacterium]|nr:cytochrome c1 [Verrucomicrobiales bacterium]
LTSVGRKLKEEWLTELLTKGTKVRPYMATRMPIYGEANIGHLPAQFAKADGGDQPDKPVLASLDDAKFGRKLLGTSGLSCIACHNFGKYASLGIPALNLTDMTHRLRKEWFHEYLKNPFALRPGTRMPSFWPDGNAVNTDIFNGNTERQIDAIWAFLDGDPGSSPPDGLVQGQWELVADENAVIYRHFIEGSGSRAIGVGFPEKANLSWDANEMRLAMIWHGPFMDLAKHRTGRGPGYEAPLGRNVVKLPEGPPLAVLPSPTAAWPSTTGLAAGYRMRGYDLDEQLRPAFRYDFHEVSVRDYTVARPGVVDAFLVRTLTFTSTAKPASLFFRLAVGEQIERQADGSWLIDGRVKMKFPNASGWATSRQSEGRTELLMPVGFDANGKAEIVQEFVW